MDKVYIPPDPCVRFMAQKDGERRNHIAQWVYQLDPGNPQERAAPLLILS